MSRLTRSNSQARKLIAMVGVAVLVVGGALALTHRAAAGPRSTPPGQTASDTSDPMSSEPPQQVRLAGRHASLDRVAGTADDFLLLGTVRPRRNNLSTLWASTDGTHWRRTAVPTSENMISDLVATDDRYAMLGSARVWSSRNGVTWRAAHLPGAARHRDGGLDFTRVGLLAWLRTDLASGEGRVWRSTDGGRSWTTVLTIRHGYACSISQRGGQTILGGVRSRDGEPVTQTWRSTDGVKWSVNTTTAIRPNQYCEDYGPWRHRSTQNDLGSVSLDQVGAGLWFDPR